MVYDRQFGGLSPIRHSSPLFVNLYYREVVYSSRQSSKGPVELLGLAGLAV